MNKKITAALVFLAAASVSYAFDTWYGSDGIYQIDTGLDAGDGKSGYWFSYADDADGGASKVTWKVTPGNEYDDNALDPVIDACGGVCGTITLDKGTLDYDPFVGIGFNVAGENDETADATAWGGVCISYTSDLAPTLELGLGAFDASIEYANPFVSLPKAAAAAATKDLTWADFAQPSWYKKDTKITGPEAATQLVAVKFKVQGKTGSSGAFNIMSIGPNGGGCKAGSGPADAIKAPRAVSAVKATLNDRMLSFSGIKSAASAEIINLQGRIVMKSAIDASASLNLASLDAGIYMVRVAGKSVDFSQKIVIR